MRIFQINILRLGTVRLPAAARNSRSFLVESVHESPPAALTLAEAWPGNKASLGPSPSRDGLSLAKVWFSR